MLNSHRKTILEALGRRPIHPFPARMAPGIALDALGESGTPLKVLDPMAGSGTVVAVARANGHKAFGVDLDPLAVLLASVWTRTIDAQQVNNKAEEVLARAKKIAVGLPARCAYPTNSDDETRKFIRYWFDESARRQLTALSIATGRVRDRNARDALWCGFSRLIITKQAGASLARDLSHSRPHRAFLRAPIEPFDRFLLAVQSVVSNCPQVGIKKIGPPAVVRRGDAKALSIEDGSIDLVLTSPPYLNAIDYMRCSKFSLVWMGYKISELRQLRAASVGTEAAFEEAMESTWVRQVINTLRLNPTLPNRQQALLATYIWDMDRAMSEVSRVLRTRGRAVYVVGDSTIRGTFVRNSAIISAAAENHGLVSRSRHVRVLPSNRRYLPPPDRERPIAKMNSRMRREIVLSFEKVP
jgi:DNA modification methylase